MLKKTYGLTLKEQIPDLRVVGKFRIQDIIRYDKNSGDYLFHDIQPAIEYGYDDKLTIGLQLMFFHHDYQVAEDGLALWLTLKMAVVALKTLSTRL